MPYVYIGRTTYFKGKTLWEILGNLKNFGVGRVVIRNRFIEQYPERSYIRIKEVRPEPNPENPSMDSVRKVSVFVEKVFRGKRCPDTYVWGASCKTDYRLVPKDEEAEYCKIAEKKPEKIFPRTTVFPPLMRELILREAKANGEELKEEPKLVLQYRIGVNNNIRVAKEGETPNMEIGVGLGTPASPSLYERIKLDRKN